MRLLYFAYASNMSLAQMLARCPDSVKLGIGHLPDHRLIFPRFSKNRQCGVASVAPHAASAVWGVIFDLSPADAARLDRFEGHQADRHPALNNYNRSNITVLAEGPHGERLDCMTYLATVQGEHFAPDAAYHGTLLQGARENRLPAHYIDWLERIPLMTERRSSLL